MQAKKRYILVFVCCAFLAYCYFGGYRLKHSFKNDQIYIERLPSFIVKYSEGISDFTASNNKKNLKYEEQKTPLNSNHFPRETESKLCTMETCFDYTKCDKFLVYIYPFEPLNSLGSSPPVSSNYQKIVTAITESRYYTTDPEEACLFVLGIDTLDRDTLSEDYVRNVPPRLSRLKYWNNGINHIIFNLYSGTWPDYSEDSLGFDPGYAILAKASMSIQQLRKNFDISIPLFHKQFPLRSGNTGLVTSNNFPANKKYLLAFKGKR